MNSRTSSVCWCGWVGWLRWGHASPCIVPHDSIGSPPRPSVVCVSLVEPRVKQETDLFGPRQNAHSMR